LLVSELAEAESFRAVGDAVIDQADIGDWSATAEVIAELSLGGVVRDVADSILCSSPLCVPVRNGGASAATSQQQSQKIRKTNREAFLRKKTLGEL